MAYGAAAISYNNYGSIINCTNNGNMTATDCVGGITRNNEGHIISCLNTGNITATNSTGTGIFSGVGGIVGTAANG